MRSQTQHPTRARRVYVRPAGAAARAPEPEDSALYRCGCGKAFKAAVSTCVTCPACGHLQAW